MTGRYCLLWSRPSTGTIPERGTMRSWTTGPCSRRKGRKRTGRSAAYRRQTRFHGSDREVRGAILRLLVKGKALSEATLADLLGAPAERLRKNVLALAEEGFIRESAEGYTIA